MERIVADLVVLGTGGAGMSAAVRAAEGGAQVVVLEKRPFPGGTSNTPMCVAVTKKDPAYQDQAFKTHMDMTNWTGNADLVRAWINKTGDVVEWLEKQGYKMFPTPVSATLETMGKQRGYGSGFPNGYFIHDLYFMPAEGSGHGGATMIKALVKKAKELGVDIRYSTPAKKLLKANGRITGVLAENKDGDEIYFDAKAVIVATGGFNDDAEMIAKHSGFKFKLDPTGNGEEGNFFWMFQGVRLSGDGIKMAWEVGAGKGAMGIGAFPHVPGPGVIGHVPWMMLSQARIVQEQPYLCVNNLGRRFFDEGLMDDHFTSGNLVARQPGCEAFVIMDEDTKIRLETVGLDKQYFIFKAKTLTDLDGDFRKLMEQGNKHVFIADSIEDLAQQAGICPKGLAETVGTYNGYCDQGRDEQFGKEPKWLYPVRKGKLYAVRMLTTAYQTVGGIKVNGKTEAMTPELQVIPGLYAAGDIVAAELFGDPPTLGIGTLSVALGTGLVAGESALAYIKK